MLSVFLSSTFKGQLVERGAVEAAIYRMSAVYMWIEQVRRSAEEPIAHALHKVKHANALILVLGHRSNAIPDDALMEIIEAEYQEAYHNNIPILGYILDPSLHNDSYVYSRWKKFEDYVRKIHKVTLFRTPEELAWNVISDLARQFSDRVNTPYLDMTPLQNAILMDSIRDQVAVLIVLFEYRAQRILEKGRSYFKYTSFDEYADTFKDLHQKHIHYLKGGNIGKAHEMLIEIHAFSVELSKGEFWARQRVENPDVQFNLALDAFQRGFVNCIYMAGSSDSDKYPSNIGISTHQSAKTLTPAISLEMYRMILSGDLLDDLVDDSSLSSNGSPRGNIVKRMIKRLGAIFRSG